MQLSYESRFLIALIQTLAVETPLLLLLTKVAVKKRFAAYGWPFILAMGLTASLLTLPYVWFIFPYFIRDRVWYLAAAETFALLLEALLYSIVFKIPCWLGLGLSFVCNLASFLSSYLIKFFIP